MQYSKLTGGLKNNIRNLDNFHVSSRKSENLHFDELLLSLAYKVSDKKVQKRNLLIFNASRGKSENLYFDWLLLSKVCNV